ncbi:hypothetical protein EVAR_65785_1 [Eumeta japonica]|uniref:Secreted protein n=1 Tax=Eumeta variegata TaxID=151549 RepID=A0A4C2A3E8_EUMVA|nr:hypothetical protein EVAR_65785_1 [Eumeta japonica]
MYSGCQAIFYVHCRILLITPLVDACESGVKNVRGHFFPNFRSRRSNLGSSELADYRRRAADDPTSGTYCLTWSPGRGERGLVRLAILIGPFRPRSESKPTHPPVRSSRSRPSHRHLRTSKRNTLTRKEVRLLNDIKFGLRIRKCCFGLFYTFLPSRLFSSSRAIRRRVLE